MRRCPECKETGCIVTERRPNGDSKCTQCGHRDATLHFDQPAPSYKELEARNAELETYKKDWQEIAGRANLKHLVARNEELEKKLAEAESMLKITTNTGCGAIKDLGKYKEKLKVAIEALTNIHDYGEYADEKETPKIWRICDEALSKIKSEGI